MSRRSCEHRFLCVGRENHWNENSIGENIYSNTFFTVYSLEQIIILYYDKYARKVGIMDKS